MSILLNIFCESIMHIIHGEAQCVHCYVVYLCFNILFELRKDCCPCLVHHTFWGLEPGGGGANDVGIPWNDAIAEQSSHCWHRCRAVYDVVSSWNAMFWMSIPGKAWGHDTKIDEDFSKWQQYFLGNVHSAHAQLGSFSKPNRSHYETTFWLHERNYTE